MDARPHVQNKDVGRASPAMNTGNDGTPARPLLSEERGWDVTSRTNYEQMRERAEKAEALLDEIEAWAAKPGMTLFQAHGDHGLVSGFKNARKEILAILSKREKGQTHD